MLRLMGWFLDLLSLLFSSLRCLGFLEWVLDDGWVYDDM